MPPEAPRGSPLGPLQDRLRGLRAGGLRGVLRSAIILAYKPSNGVSKLPMAMKMSLGRF